MSINHWPRLSRHEEPGYPLAEWELPIAADTSAQLRHGLLDWATFCPNRGKGMPWEAAAALRKTLGAVSSAACLVIPWSTRHLHGRCYAYTPTSVVAAGERGIGLWVDDLRGPEVVANMRYQDICAIRMLTTARHGRLVLIGKGRELTFECETTTGKPLADFADRVRRAVLSEPRPLPEYSARVPQGWRAIVASAIVRLDNDQPVSVVSYPERHTRRRHACTLIALTPFELVVLRASDGTPAPRSIECLAIPRPRITGIDADHGTLHVTSPGAEQVISASAEVLRNARRELADVLPWAGARQDPAPRTPGKIHHPDQRQG
ncbi:MAG: hypothetical protein ACRDRN_09140 [Sciscionella sp.]